MGWLRALIGWRNVDRRVDTELQFHIDAQVEAYVTAGLSPDEARRRARVDFGGRQQIAERCREVWILPTIESAWQDLRYAVRMLRRNPGFTLVTVVTLALGIGANTAIFSVVHGVVLRPLPYPDADRLVVLQGAHPERGTHPYATSRPDFEDWRAQTTSFESMAQFAYWTFNLTGREVPERLLGGRVGGAFFETLGAPALLGRALTADDDRGGREFVAVLAFGAWQRVFGGDPAVVGQAVTLNGRPHTIVGVMPATFRFPAEDVELWAPIGDQLGTDRGSRFLFTFGRLHPDASLDDARGEMAVIARRLATDYPFSNSDWGLALVPAQDTIVGDVRPALLALLGAVGLVLLIACGNVASLLLARAASRQRELAVRAAIGAGRGRLIRQFLTEGLLLAAIGGSLGLALATWLVRLLTRQVTVELPRLDEVGIDATVGGFTLALSLSTTLLFGLLPALSGARTTPSQSLLESGRTLSGGGRHRLRTTLVVAEVAMALMLLIGGGLLVRSFTSLLAVDPGFDATNVLHMSVFLGPPDYREIEAQKAYATRALERIERLPGIAGVASVTQVPIVDSTSSLGFQIEGRAVPLSEAPAANYLAVSAGYFQTMRIPILRGRGVQRVDAAGAPLVVVINEAMARRFWPVADPIGHRIRWARESDDQGWLTIVGVVASVRSRGLGVEEAPAVYAPYRQRAFPWLRWVSLVVRTEGDPEARIADVRRQLLAVDPNQPVYGIETLAATVDASIGTQRLNALLTSLFALLAATLAAIGIYGVVSYHVEQRTREIGLRRALGARPRDVVAAVVREGLTLSLGGIALGLAAALVLSRYLASLLFGIAPTDLLTYAVAPLLLLAVATLASIVPARRAARVDPMRALRTE